MNDWHGFPSTLMRGLFGSPRRALYTSIALIGLLMLFVPPAREGLMHSIIEPVVAVVLIVGIIWMFFIQPFIPKKKKASDKK